MNQTKTLLHTVKALALAFALALLSLGIFCLIAWRGDDPMRMLPLFASLSLMLTGGAAGFFGAAGQPSPLGSGMLTGTVAMLTVAGISFFFGKQDGGELRSLLLAGGMLIAAFAGAWLHRRPARRRPASPAQMRKRAVGKMRMR